MSQEIEQQFEEIITLLEKHPEGLSISQIIENIGFIINAKTVQRRLAALVEDERIARTGVKKTTRYHALKVVRKADIGHSKDKPSAIFSLASQEKLKFLDIPSYARDNYNAALLAVYEKNDIEPMLDLFAWAYSRSCKQYGVVKRTLGEIDVFRIRYRQHRKAIMGHIIKRGLQGSAVEAAIEKYGREQGVSDVDKFTAMTLADLSTIHEGMIFGLGITKNQLDVWLSSQA